SFFTCTSNHRELPSFPTRRSSDLRIGSTRLNHNSPAGLEVIGIMARIVSIRRPATRIVRLRSPLTDREWTKPRSDVRRFPSPVDGRSLPSPWDCTDTICVHDVHVKGVSSDS